MRYIQSFNVVAIIILLCTMLVGCGGTYEVPSAHVGKMLDSNGFSPEVINPGRTQFMLPAWSGREMVLLEVGTNTPAEKMSMKLADDLTLKFSVRVRVSVKRTPDALNTVFHNMNPSLVSINGDTRRVITFMQLYETYAQMEIQDHARRVVATYTIDEIQENFGRISSEIFNSAKLSMEATPLVIESMNLINIDYPSVVDNAILAIKDRDLSILKEEAEVARKLVEKAGALRVANSDREVKLTMARTERDANKIIGDGITPAFLALKQLESQDAMAANKSAVFLPFSAIDNVGAQIKMFNK